MTNGATSDETNRHVWSHVFNLIMLGGGAVALAVMMHALGWANTRTVFENVGDWYLLILALDLAGMALDAGAIHSFMRPEARMVSYWRVFAAQASGRAINIFVPGGVVGEATKVTMLMSHAPRDRVVSSILLFNLATFYISVTIVLVGVPITALVVDLPRELTIVVWLGLAILVPLAIALAVVIHRGAITTLTSGLRALRIVSAERAARWKAKLVELDRHLRELQSNASPGTRLALALLAGSRVIAWLASITVLAAVGVHLRLTLVVGVLSVGVLISWVSALIPFGLGIADGGNYALFGALGASGANGVFVTLLNRARTLAVALFGLVIMAIAHTANRISIARRRRRLASRLAPGSPTTIA